jgi:hypothetical protein
MTVHGSSFWMQELKGLNKLLSHPQFFELHVINLFFTKDSDITRLEIFFINTTYNIGLPRTANFYLPR